MLVCGVGFGFFQTPNNRSMLGAAPPDRSGAAGALQATARLFGQTLGVTMLALCLQGSSTEGAGSALLIGAGLAVGSALVSIGRGRATGPDRGMSAWRSTPVRRDRAST